MDAKALSKFLGWFSIGLGAAELIAGRQIADKLGTSKANVVRGFGMREIGAGAAIMQDPASSARVWNRVAGDAMDAAALAPLVRRDNPQRGWAIGALAFVAGAAALDVFAAMLLQKQVGEADYLSEAENRAREPSDA